MKQLPAQLERRFFNLLNRFAEPLIRAGVGNPVLWPTGTIVLETTGRSTGRTYNVPLLATRVGDLMVVGTIRRRSEWLRNVTANRRVRYWLGGRLHEATAFVIAPGLDGPPREKMPPRVKCLAYMLGLQSCIFGMRFAILTPRNLERRFTRSLKK
jgi:deazaflavin-dependent oxidoreductase (nitroreductase family)